MFPRRLFRSPLLAFALAVTAVALVASAGAAPKHKILHAFGKGTDGGGLWASLAFDPQGNLYGATATGVAGVAFELTP